MRSREKKRKKKIQDADEDRPLFLRFFFVFLFFCVRFLPSSFSSSFLSGLLFQMPDQTARLPERERENIK